MTRLKEVRISKRGQRRLRGRHPWIYRDELESSPALRAGEEVLLRGERWLGRGLWEPTGPIAIRRFSRDPDRTFATVLGASLQRALLHRDRLFGGDADTTGYRLFNGAGDGVPGMVVDRYADWLGMRLYSNALEARGEELLAAWGRALPDVSGIYAPELSVGSPPEALSVQERGLRFEVGLRASQKTGLFFDQRDNRSRLEALVRPGEPVLNLFSYTGGFGLYGARAGGRVTQVDVSAGALEAARRNHELNGTEARFLKRDLLKGSPSLPTPPGGWPVIVCDPPMLARSAEQMGAAHKAYRRINRWCLKALARDAIFATFSCTARLTLSTLHGLVKEAAREAGRSLILLELSEHAPDHPVPADFIEGRYLKGLFFRVL